jgi:hypothetical protein
MTNAFQVIFDLAETISINKRGIVGQSISRSQTVRSISRGGEIWRFDVKLPDGLPWDQMRPYIEQIDAADRFTLGNVSISDANQSVWLNNYRGNAVSTTGFVANATVGSKNLTITSKPTITSGNLFGAGDIIQLGTSGHVYSVTSPVAYTANVVPLNRPVIDSTGSYSLRVGPSCVWKVICVEMPTWTIFARNQVSWSGNFVFYEADL